MIKEMVKMEVKQKNRVPYDSSRIMKFTWNDKKNKFIHPTVNLSKFNGKEVQVITAIVDQLEVYSGLKRPSLIIRNIFFLIILVGGLSLAFFLIQHHYSKLGFFMIIISVMSAYFLTIGYSMIQKTQIQKAEEYLEVQGPILIEKLSPYMLTMLYSFNSSKFIFQTQPTLIQPR